MNGLFKATAKHLNLNRNLNCDYATPKLSLHVFLQRHFRSFSSYVTSLELRAMN